LLKFKGNGTFCSKNIFLTRGEADSTLNMARNGRIHERKILDGDQIGAEPELVNLLRSPGIDSKPGVGTTPCLTYCI
jgi:hypothetical protein